MNEEIIVTYQPVTLEEIQAYTDSLPGLLIEDDELALAN
jgi:hypothetical protein